MPMVELRGLSALEAWCRKVTAGYKDVKVTDLSTSWRDGLAFCALIHHFRPDLIDYSGLSKENVLYNNRLAFAVAEKHLGVPSLLDAEDMVTQEEPDRLSIATYLSQFYERFEGSKSDRKPSISGTNNSIQVKSDANDIKCNESNISKAPIPPKRDIKCHKCNHRVFLLDRVTVDDKFYHKACYDTIIDNKQNDHQQNGDKRVFQDECVDNVDDETSDKCLNNEQNIQVLNKLNMGEAQQIIDLKEKDELQENIELNSDKINENKNVETNEMNDKKDIEFDKEEHSSNSDSLTVCDTNVPGVIDANKLNLANNEPNKKTVYPVNKNPFGSDEEEDEQTNDSKLYPSDLNPFGEEEEEEEEEEIEIEPFSTVTIRKTNSSLNPFGDDDDEDADDKSNKNTPVPVPRKSLHTSTCSVSPTSTIKSSPRKKRPAPTPPSKLSSSLSQNNLDNSQSNCNEDVSRRSSIISSVSSEMPSSVPSSRTPTPQPRVRFQKSNANICVSSESQLNNDSCNSNNEVETNRDENVSINVNTFGFWKNKKRPAPPIPIIKRTVRETMSLSDIEKELNSIGDELQKLEARGADIENIIKGNNETTIEDTVMKEFMEMARERCSLARRQKELMYMKREHKLEEIQADIEYQMRLVMSKQAAQKTEEDEKREEELLRRLIEIIEERNDIVENLTRDENKEVEEYHKLISRVKPLASSNGTGTTSSQLEDTKSKVKKKEKHKKEKADEVKSDSKKEKHFTLGKSTLKRLGIKSSEKGEKPHQSDKKNTKKSDLK